MNLGEYLARCSMTPFEWGKNDCVLFVTRWIKEATGKDLLAGIQPWDSKVQALRRLAELGGLELAAMRVLGLPRTGFADGDVAYLGAPFNCMGIVNGAYVAVLDAQDGLGILSTQDAKHIWDIKNV